MELISDGLLLAAALAAIFYCWAISARLGALKRQSGELATRLDEFNASLAEAGKMITAARTAAESESGMLTELVVEARALQERVETATAALNRATRKGKPAKPRIDPEDEADADAELLEGMKRLASRRRAREVS